MRVYLPFPPAELSPNARKHWRSVAPHKAAYKDACYYLTKQAMPPIWEVPFVDLPLKVTFMQPDMRSRDVDNMLASIKAAIDGFALALGVNDRQFKPITVDWMRGKKPGAVVLEF